MKMVRVGTSVFDSEADEIISLTREVILLVLGKVGSEVVESVFVSIWAGLE